MNAIDFAVGRDQVEVPLDQRHIACPRHAEPFRAEWPHGWEGFALEVSTQALGSPALQAGLSDPRFWRATELIWEELPRRRTPAEVRLLLDVRPACEWIPEQVLLAAYRASGVGTVALCQVCRVFDLGTRYGLREGQGMRTIAHACFRCVVANRVGAR